jgi:hypothetical protein
MTKSTTSPATRPLSVAAVVGLVLVSWLVGHLAATGALRWDWDAFDWVAATAAATAYGTLALALVTLRLVAFTSGETSATRQLAEQGAQAQWMGSRAEERARIQSVLAAVQEITDYAIATKAFPGQASSFEAAKSHLSTAIAFSGHAPDLGQADLLTRPERTPDEARRQADAARAEIAALLDRFDETTRAGPPQRQDK